MKPQPTPDRLLVGFRAGSAVLLAVFLAALAGAMANVGMGVAAILTGTLALLMTVPAIGVRWWPTGSDPFALDGVADESAGRVRAAAGQGERLRQLADASPEGPVREHLVQLAHTAEGYVEALRVTLDAADTAAPGSSGPGLRADADRVIAQLRELTTAAERLRTAQRRRLETSPLEELTERTRRLAEAIESPTDSAEEPRP